MIKEIWKEIPNTTYFISNFGNIKNKFGKKLKPSYDKDGYLEVKLHINKIPVHKKMHRLVAQAFLNNYSEELQVNHLNGKKDCNIYTNLEMCTNSENVLHSCYVLGNKIKNVYQFDLYGNFIKKWLSAEKIKEELGYNSTSIWKVCNNQHNTAYGYKWSYNSKLTKEELNKPIRDKIIQYDINMNFIKEFNSIKEAHNITKINNISACCRGIQKTAGGYIWKYKSEVMNNVL